MKKVSIVLGHLSDYDTDATWPCLAFENPIVAEKCCDEWDALAESITSELKAFTETRAIQLQSERLKHGGNLAVCLSDPEYQELVRKLSDKEKAIRSKHPDPQFCSGAYYEVEVVELR
jgi:hypothetical protein